MGAKIPGLGGIGEITLDAGTVNAKVGVNVSLVLEVAENGSKDGEIQGAHQRNKRPSADEWRAQGHTRMDCSFQTALPPATRAVSAPRLPAVSVGE